MAGRLRTALTSPEPARAACHPARAVAERRRRASALTRRSQRLSTGVRGRRRALSGETAGALGRCSRTRRIESILGGETVYEPSQVGIGGEVGHEPLP